jgi:hypothetical protein
MRSIVDVRSQRPAADFVLSMCVPATPAAAVIPALADHRMVRGQAIEPTSYLSGKGFSALAGAGARKVQASVWSPNTKVGHSQ